MERPLSALVIVNGVAPWQNDLSDTVEWAKLNGPQPIMSKYVFMALVTAAMPLSQVRHLHQIYTNVR